MRSGRSLKEATMTTGNTAAGDFQRDWAQFHSTCLPLGWMLRGRVGSPWVR